MPQDRACLIAIMSLANYVLMGAEYSDTQKYGYLLHINGHDTLAENTLFFIPGLLPYLNFEKSYENLAVLKDFLKVRDNNCTSCVDYDRQSEFALGPVPKEYIQALDKCFVALHLFFKKPEVIETGEVDISGTMSCQAFKVNQNEFVLIVPKDEYRALLPSNQGFFDAADNAESNAGFDTYSIDLNDWTPGGGAIH